MSVKILIVYNSPKVIVYPLIIIGRNITNHQEYFTVKTEYAGILQEGFAHNKEHNRKDKNLQMKRMCVS